MIGCLWSGFPLLPEPSSSIFYESSKGNPGPAGFGCVVRDCQSLVVHVYTVPLCLCGFMKTEVMGLPMGLRELQKLGFSNLLVEGDSSVVIG